MGSCYQLQSVDVTKIIGDFRAEDPACSSSVDCPVFDVLRVRPHQIAEGAFMGNLNLAVDGSNLVDGLDFRAESSVHAKDLALIREGVPSMTAPMGR